MMNNLIHLKSSLLFIVTLMIVQIAKAQPPSIAWQKCLGGTINEEAHSIQQTADGGYIVAGDTDSNDGDVSGNHGSIDVWVVKLNSSGSITWQKCLGGSGWDYAFSIQQTSDGGYIMAGYTASNDGDVSGNHGNDDFWVVKLNAEGSITWQKCLGGSNEEWPLSIQQTSDGGYIVAGYTNSNDGDVSGNHNPITSDYWVVKLNSSGSITWQKCLGGSQDEGAYSIQQTSDGGYIVAGISSSNDDDVSGNHGYSDYWVVKLNADGLITWQKSLGGSWYDVATSIQQTPDDGYIVAGHTFSNNGDVSGNHGDYDQWVVKLNSSGSITWQKCLGGTDTEDAWSMQQTTDGGFIVSGDTESNNGDVSGNHGGTDFWAVKLNSSGSITWQKCLGGSSYDHNSSIFQTLDGGYIVAGSTASNDGNVSGNHGAQDFWVVKLGSAPCSSLNATGMVINASCYNSSNGSINITPPNNGTPPYSYEWSNGATTEDISGLIASTYSLTITDGNSCTTTFSFNVTSPSLINISITPIPITCYGESNGSITATPSGGTPGYSYLWSNGATTNTITNLSAGTYSLTVTDANSCTLSTSFNLTQPVELTTEIIDQDVTCFGASNGMATAVPNGGTPGYEYEWSNSNTNSSISNLSPGTYDVTVTDINGCSVTGSVEISEPPLLTLSTSSQNVTCYGAMNGSATVTPSGGTPGYSYLWSNGSSTSTISNLNPGMYMVTVPDTHACTITASVVITGPTALVLTLTGNNVSCYGDSNGWIDADVSGGIAGYTYLWSTGMTTDSIANLAAGIYELTITDASGCTLASDYEVYDPPLIIAQLISSLTICNDSTGSAHIIAIGGTGSLSYLWNTGETTTTIENLPQGLYAVTVTDTNACTNVQNTEVVAIDTEAPVILQTSDTLYVNAIGSIDDYSALQNDFTDECGDFSFQILNADSISCTTDYPDTLEVLVTDLAGNDTMYEIFLDLVDTIRPQIMSCPANIEQGNCQGPVLFDVPFATDNCQLDTFYQTSGLPPGAEFPIGNTLNEWLAIDKSGNSTLCSFMVSITDGIILQADVYPISCHNLNDGAISIDTANITPPFSIVWSTGDSTTSITNLAEGVYSVTLTDFNDCQARDTFQIINPESLSVTLLEVHDATAPDSSNGSIIISVSGGTPSYLFKWTLNDSIVSTDQNPSHLSPGTYMIILEDAHGCVYMGNEVTIGVISEVIDPADPVIFIYPNPVSDILNITSDRKIDAYKIINLDGKVIRSGRIDAESWIVDMSEEKEGFYILALYGDGRWEVVKLVVDGK